MMTSLLSLFPPSLCRLLRFVWILFFGSIRLGIEIVLLQANSREKRQNQTFARLFESEYDKCRRIWFHCTMPTIRWAVKSDYELSVKQMAAIKLLLHTQFHDFEKNFDSINFISVNMNLICVWLKTACMKTIKKKQFFSSTHILIPWANFPIRFLFPRLTQQKPKQMNHNNSFVEVVTCQNPAPLSFFG